MLGPWASLQQRGEAGQGRAGGGGVFAETFNQQCGRCLALGDLLFQPSAGRTSQEVIVPGVRAEGGSGWVSLGAATRAGLGEEVGEGSLGTQGCSRDPASIPPRGSLAGVWGLAPRRQPLLTSCGNAGSLSLVPPGLGGIGGQRGSSEPRALSLPGGTEQLSFAVARLGGS